MNASWRLASAGRHWPFRLRHIRTKVILPYAILTVLLAMIGTYLVTQLVAGSLQERFDNQLAEAGRVAADAVVRQEEHQLGTVRAMAFTQGVPDAIERHDTQRLRALLEPVIANDGIERAVVVDANGNALLSLTAGPEGEYTNSEAAGASEWWVTQQALGGADALGDKYAGLVETDEGFVLFTSAAVLSGDRHAGVVLAGTSLDTLVTQIKGEALADLTVYNYQGRAIASTFPDSADAAPAVDLSLPSPLVDRAINDADTAVRDSRTLFKRDYDLAYGLLEIRQNVVGIYSVALPTNFIVAAGARTRMQTSAIFGAAMAAVLVVGYLVAQRITTPVQRLAVAAQRLASGDLTTRSAVQSDDEIGLLAGAFDQMADNLEQQTEQLRRQHVGTVRALTSAVDARDPYTLGHSVRVGQLAVLLGQRLRLDEQTLERIEIGGYLHDVGKIGVRDVILLKPGPLTPEEHRRIETHPVVGLKILEPVGFPPEVLDFVRGHHERLDGTGYPDRRRGDDLSVVARIAAVADMYDAMTSGRPYRPALTPHQALETIKSQAGTLLDSDAVAALEAVLFQWERRRRADPLLKGFELPEEGDSATIRSAAA